MNLLSSFIDFYDGLSSDGLFFFWIIVFLFLFLIFLTIVLVVKNKKLIKLLKEDNQCVKDKFEEIPLMGKNEEIVNQDEEQVVEIKDNVEVQDDIKIDKEEKTEVEKQVVLEVKEETGPYKKNVLREMNARMQTSPISIRRDDVIYNTNNNSYNDEYELDEIYLREESVSPLESMEDSFDVSDNMRFASEIVEKMEEEIKPSNIELTDYEKKQEEEAIISYDELLKVKDRIYNLTEDEETDEFIDQLKSFRLDL